MYRILVVDNDLKNGRKFARFAESLGYKAQMKNSVNAAVNLLKKEEFDLVILNFTHSDQSALDTLKKLKIVCGEAPIILSAQYSDVKFAVTALKKGAQDYLTDPIHPDELKEVIREALEKKENRSKLGKARGRLKKQPEKEFLTGPSPQSQAIMKQIDLIASTDMTVIIGGETGSGKEFVAKRIHRKSSRSKGPFVALDCGALPDNLVASELFGHVKGAFTGAVTDKKGVFEMANGGTLFLDEIGNLNYENQMSLLRVIQERNLRRVGGTKLIPFDVRIIVATNEDLREKVLSGDFREDLYFRLNEFMIHIPPLRERKQDIEVFAMHFLKLANIRLKKNISAFEPEAIKKLKSYYWHGNLRELNNVVKKSVLLSESDHINPEVLPPEIGNPLQESQDEMDSLKEITRKAQKSAILKALKSVNYNKSKAARLLSLNRKTLYNKIEELDIRLP